MNKKTIIILSIGILATLGLGALFYLNNQRQEIENATPLTLKPNITKVDLGEYPLNFQISESDYNIPLTIFPLRAELGAPITQDQALSFAQEFNFDTPPIIANDVDQGTTYIWSTIEQSLTVYSTSRRIKYSRPIVEEVVIDSNLRDSEIQQIAEDFLERISLTNLDFSSISYIKQAISGDYSESLVATSPENADFYQVNFAPSSTDGQVLTLDPKSSPFYVWILRDGSVAKAEGILYQSVTPSLERVRIKSYQEIVNSLSTATIATIESDQSGSTYAYNLKEGDIISADIESIELVHIINAPLAVQFYPMFLLKGTAEIRGIQGKQNVSLFLTAAIEN